MPPVLFALTNQERYGKSSGVCVADYDIELKSTYDDCLRYVTSRHATSHHATSRHTCAPFLFLFIFVSPVVIVGNDTRRRRFHSQARVHVGDEPIKTRGKQDKACPSRGKTPPPNNRSCHAFEEPGDRHFYVYRSAFLRMVTFCLLGRVRFFLFIFLQTAAPRHQFKVMRTAIEAGLKRYSDESCPQRK